MGNDMNGFKKLETHYSPEEVGLEEPIELRRFGSICKELKIFRKCRKKVHRSMKEERAKKLSALLDRLDTLIREWQGELPDLKKFFRRNDIDWLLAQAAMKAVKSDLQRDQGQRIIAFVARSGYKDQPDLNIFGKPIFRRATALHRFIGIDDPYPNNSRPAVGNLFQIYNRVDVNYTDESGYTHFHVACTYDFVNVVKKFLEFGQDPNLLWKKTGDSPLLLALRGRGSTRTPELLIKNGANLNWANKDEITPLHGISGMFDDPCDLMEMFFNMKDELNQPVKIDIRDKCGNTPLHCAVGKPENTTKLLLRRGANPNSVNNEGSTPLHLISQMVMSQYSVKMFFKFNDELHQQVEVDVWDKKGHSPLQLAFLHGNDKTAEILLRRGASPNMVNEDGLTPLHSICQTYLYDNLAKIFFDINDELNQVIEVDAMDKSGRTPLQLAVANLKPKCIDVLLDRGADLSSFVFPNESDFDEGFDEIIKRRSEDKLMVACGLMAVVENLEARGYELDRSDALKIMRLFSKYGLFEKPINRAKCWYDDEDFATEAKETMVNSSLSLYDLMQLRPEEAEKLLTCEHYYTFRDAIYAWKCTSVHYKAYHTHLIEKMSRGFFWCWAMDPFRELTHYRLTHLHCEMIMDKLDNEDLYHICVAASG